MARQRRRESWAWSSRWTEREAREALAALERSGERLAAFAKREGLSAERLYRWRARLSEAAFVEIPADPAVSVGEGMLEVVVEGGRIVRVPRDFDEVTLRRLLAVLEGDRC